MLIENLILIDLVHEIFYPTLPYRWRWAWYAPMIYKR